MSKSARLRLADVRAAFRLVGDCRDLGRDGRAWRDHLAAATRRTVGGVMAVVGEVPPTRPDAGFDDPAWSAFTCCGLPPAVERAWADLYLRDNAAVRDCSFRAFVPLRGRVVARHRGQVVAARDWERSEELLERRRPLGVDGILMGRAALPPPDSVLILTAHRAVGDRPFTDRTAAFVHLLLDEVVRLVGGPLARARGGPADGLPARARAVLDRLLAGDSEKQAALALGMSRHTVHGHVKALYRRFEVASRAELLARLA